MPNGRPDYIISEESVRQALNGLIMTSDRFDDSPLKFLYLVDLHLLENDLSYVDDPRHHALFRIVTNSIKTEYVRLRYRLGLATTIDQSQQTLTHPKTTILQDLATGGVELFGWSWLYHFFVAVHWNLSLGQIAAYAGINERTMRRYQKHGIRRLTENLVEREASARRNYQMNNLLAQLPRYGNIRMIGRADLLKRATTMLLTHQPRHLLISGTVGIGKTDFAECLAKQLIESLQVDRVVWLDAPLRMADILSVLRELLLDAQSTVSLRSYFMLVRVLIVLDDSDALCEDSAELERLLSYLSAAWVVVISRKPITLDRLQLIRLSELDDAAIEELTQREVSAIQDGAFALDVNRILEVVGGNPLAVKLMLRNLEVFDWHEAVIRSTELIVATIYESLLAPDTRLLWLILVLLPSRTVSQHNILSSFVGIIQQQAMNELLEKHVIEYVDEQREHIRVMTATRSLIATYYKHDITYQIAFESLLRTIPIDKADNMFAISIFEAVLAANWIVLDPQFRLERIRVLWRMARPLERWSIWKQILHPYRDESNDLELTLGYAICIRHLAEWENARQILELVSRKAGIDGAFLLQVEANFELAVLYRLQGYYALFDQIVGQIEQYLTHVHDVSSELGNAIIFEKAQRALEASDVAYLERLLGQLPDRVGRQILYLELFCLRQDYDQLLVRAQHYLKQADLGRSTLGRILTLIGRAYQGLSDYSRAETYLALSASYFDVPNSDPLGLGRALSNLAAAKIQTGKYDEAQGLLNQAEKIQSGIQDVVGLAATEHNQSSLRKVEKPHE